MAADEEEKKRVRSVCDDIGVLLRGVPSNYSTWSWNRSYDFKVAVKNAQKITSSSRATYESAWNALQDLRRFYQ